MILSVAPLLRDRINAHLFAVVLILELDLAVYEREQRVVAAATHVLARMNARAALTDENVAGKNELPVGAFYAEPLRVTVSAVLGGTAALFVSKQLNIDKHDIMHPPI